MGTVKTRSKFLIYFRILILGLILMVCFFNCGQPGELRLLGQSLDAGNGNPSAEAEDPDGHVTSVDIGIPGGISLPPGINEVMNEMKPALAVRATGCLMCHAQIGSNIITDFGYQGDGKGKDYFFGGKWDSFGSTGLSNTRGKAVYGDYDFTMGGDRNWSDSELDEDVAVIVPAASTENVRLPNGGALPADEFSLAAYIRKQLDNSVMSKKSQVKEVKSVFIGAPSKEKILSVSGVASNSLLYKADSGSQLFSGIELVGNKYFTNTDTIICDGDVAIDGILYLKSAQLKTKKGCRIYVTGSVFISDKVEYVDKTSKSNLQITSSRTVSMGVGFNCNGDLDSGSVRDRFQTNGSHNQINRFSNFYTRDLGTPFEMLELLRKDAEKVAVIKDAECESATGGRDGGNYERLLVNAPVIHSRYRGKFTGSIISEIALMSLNALKYDFDPVFLEKDVLILPLLKSTDFLYVEE